MKGDLLRVLGIAFSERTVLGTFGNAICAANVIDSKFGHRRGPLENHWLLNSSIRSQTFGRCSPVASPYKITLFSSSLLMRLGAKQIRNLVRFRGRDMFCMPNPEFEHWSTEKLIGT